MFVALVSSRENYHYGRCVALYKTKQMSQTLGPYIKVDIVIFLPQHTHTQCGDHHRHIDSSI